MKFSSFGLREEILRAIESAQYLQPTPIQAAAVPKILRGQDLIGIAATGTGKTAAFLWPLLHQLSQSPPRRNSRHPSTLILVPTRELALQIVQSCERYSKFLRIRATAIFGGVDEAPQIQQLRRGTDILVATPGRLLEYLERRIVSFVDIRFLVLDEADRMLHMGFLPDVETLLSSVPKHRQTLLFSATLPKEIESLSRRFLHEPLRVQIGRRGDPAETVEQSVYEVQPHLKTPLLLALLKQPKFQRVLVFVRMKDGADRLTQQLRDAHVRVAKLHSSRSQEQRLKALQDFKDGHVQVLVATDIVSRGIDIEGVTHVINYDFPVNPEDYVHRIGRTGRAEHAGEALSFIPKHDLNLLNIIELAIGQRLPHKRLRGFNYQAPPSRQEPSAPAPKRDWRKRTREMETKRQSSPAPKPHAKPRKNAKKKPSSRPPKKKP